MKIGKIRDLILVTQLFLLVIQIVTDIDWLCIAIVLLYLINLALQKYE